MLLEYNVRFGNPEAQVLMVRLMSDLLPVLIAAHDGVLRQVDLRWHDDAAMCVVMAAKGYPDAALRGVEAADRQVKIFHASTRRDGDRLPAPRGGGAGGGAAGAHPSPPPP